MAQTDPQTSTAHAQGGCPNIPHTRAGKITDRILDQLIEIGSRAQQGVALTDSEAQMILLCLPQTMAELRHRRAAMDLISDCTDLDNVRFLHAGE